MKRHIQCADTTEEQEFYCDTVGELISALKKFPKDAQLGMRVDWRTFRHSQVQVSSATGNYGQKYVLVDSSDWLG